MDTLLEEGLNDGDLPHLCLDRTLLMSSGHRYKKGGRKSALITYFLPYAYRRKFSESHGAFSDDSLQRRGLFGHRLSDEPSRPVF